MWLVVAPQKILLANSPEQGREKYEILNEKQVVK
jgi:hypothetical protein